MHAAKDFARNEDFLPGTNDLNSLRQNYIFHVMKALVKDVLGFKNCKINQA